jgi:hypothetical protein
MAGMTRGPLPPRVYWVRRLMLLGIATLLVVGLAKMLAGSSDGSSGADTARDVAQAAPLTQASRPRSSDSAGPSATARHPQKSRDTPVTEVAMPSGPCAASDVAITPSVPKSVAGGDITLVLDISTVNTPACTWTLSPNTMAIKITSGSDLIWTTSECPRAVPRQDIVLRDAAPSRVKLTWDARRSEQGCPSRTEWALPGTYHLHVAALAGQPQETAFLLTAPSPAEVTKTAHPHRHGDHGKHRKHRNRPNG